MSTAEMRVRSAFRFWSEAFSPLFSKVVVALFHFRNLIMMSTLAILGQWGQNLVRLEHPAISYLLEVDKEIDI